MATLPQGLSPKIRFSFILFSMGLISVLAISLLASCTKASEKETQLRMAADHGTGKEQFDLGKMYYTGAGVPKNFAEAAKWYRKAADQGYTYAQNNLGALYAKGEGVAHDDTEALKWFRKAADQGDDMAEYCLARAYVKGEGVDKDGAEAVKWFRKSADQGFALAQYYLGMMYADGNSMPRDYTEAAKWFHKAADQNFADAEYMLGLMYAEGTGVAKDITEASKWYRSAADHGNEKARTELVILSRPQPIQINAIQLVSEYEANEIRADSTFKGKTVSVSGYVSTVGKDILDHAYVALSGEHGPIGQVQCFLSSEAIAQASTLNPGQSVTLTGRVRGKMMNVLLEDCSF